MKELIKIQSELKAPKSQRNNFGGYNYRSAEDILESVKPILKENGCVLTVSDEMVLIGDRYYIKATATLTNSENTQISTVAFAREEETKKGMDASQITGAASSYARKYALNGLFCIDDTKDADSTNTHGKEAMTTKKAPEKDEIETELKQALDALGKCKDLDSVMEVWKTFVNLQSNHTFKNECTKTRKRIENEVKK
ncbi:ERF family protein [Petrimonas sulfuriphila]|uniref:ERF family protein n=1 Tax=Petrimonas sulfuriphila TaxID=285070 RepID=UPI003EBA2FAF